MQLFLYVVEKEMRDCLELPEGENALLGLVPLEALGLKLDFKTQQLKVLSISRTEIYLSI